MRPSRRDLWVLHLVCLLQLVKGSLSEDVSTTGDEDEQKQKGGAELVNDIRIKCNDDDITVTVSTVGESFNGMIYPKGLSKNSSCMVPYINADSQVDYVLPLRSCNTMNTDVDVDSVEYFNTIVVQPHHKLVTNQGRGYHIRCRYQNEHRMRMANLSRLIDPENAASMPGASMKIYYGEPVDGIVAESVKIGDPLALVVSIDDQDVFGMHISDCIVRDGLGWSEQLLVNKDGCPADDEIMGTFDYGTSKTTALVRFKAHKFPHASSVYYQCSVRLCIKHAGGCDDVPPVCENGLNLLKRRKRRQTLEVDETKGLLYDTDREDLKVKVYNGFYVNEATDLDNPLLNDEIAGEVSSRAYDPNFICIPQRNFAIGIAIAGLLLVIALIAAILILLTRRRRRKDLSTTGSSIYSGPYTNTAYSYSS